jgi:hypothetical protein
MNPATVSALVMTCNPHVADMLAHLGEWIKPEEWYGWVETYGIPELCDLGVIAIDSHSLDSLSRALRLTLASLN